MAILLSGVNLLEGCTQAPPLDPPRKPFAIEMPHVVAVTAETSGVQLHWTVVFSSAMAPSAIDAIEVYRVSGNIRDGQNQLEANPEDAEVTWQVGTRAATVVQPVSAPGQYVLVVGEGAADVAGLPLDGSTSDALPKPGNAHRLQDDRVRAAHRYESLAVDTRARGEPFFLTLPSAPEPYVEEIKYFDPAGDLFVYIDRPRVVASGPNDRRALPPLLGPKHAIRFRFTSDAGFPFHLMDGDLAIKMTRFVSASDVALSVPMSLTANGQALLPLGHSSKLTALGPLALTLDSDPGVVRFVGANFNPDDRLYALVGTGQVPYSRIYPIDHLAGASLTEAEFGRTLVVKDDWYSGPVTPIEPMVWRSPYRRHLLPGELVPGYALQYSTGATVQTFPIVRQGIDWFETAGGPNRCVPACTIRLVDLPSREQSGIGKASVVIVSDTYYMFTEKALTSGQVFNLRVADEPGMKNVLNLPMDDRLRDGDDVRATADRALDLKLAVIDPGAGTIPPQLWVNDGGIYSTVFEEQGLECEATGQAVCLVRSKNPCAEGIPQDRIYFSFATPDGTLATPWGARDLLQLETLGQGAIYVTRSGADGGEAAELLPIRLEPTSIASRRGDDLIPTTLVAVELIAIGRGRDGQCPASIKTGDRIVLRYTLQAEISGKSFTLDGNQDGKAEIGSIDDWVGIYAGPQQGFVPDTGVLP